MDIIVTLKDGSEHTLMLYRLMGCGLSQKMFFMESDKKGRIEFPIDSLSGFRLDRPSTRFVPERADLIVINAAIIILSQFLP